MGSVINESDQSGMKNVPVIGDVVVETTATSAGLSWERKRKYPRPSRRIVAKTARNKGGNGLRELLAIV